MIKEFGGIATVLIGNARKAMTIILSFILFPKPGSIYYLVGGTLVFGGLTLSAYSKEMGWGREGKGNMAAPAGTGARGSHQYTELATQPPGTEEEMVEKSQDHVQGWGQGRQRKNSIDREAGLLR